MKKLFFLLFLSSSLFVVSLPVNSQVLITPEFGSSVLYGLRPFVGIEVQVSSISATAKIYPTKYDGVISNGFSLFGTYYLYARNSTPFFTTGVLIQEKKNLDKITNKPVLLMPICIGYRLYPTKYNDNISESLSFDLKGGIEICRNWDIFPYVEISMNFNIFKLQKRIKLV